MQLLPSFAPLIKKSKSWINAADELDTSNHKGTDMQHIAAKWRVDNQLEQATEQAKKQHTMQIHLDNCSFLRLQEAGIATGKP